MSDLPKGPSNLSRNLPSDFESEIFDSITPESFIWHLQDEMVMDLYEELLEIYFMNLKDNRIEDNNRKIPTNSSRVVKDNLPTDLDMNNTKVHNDLAVGRACLNACFVELDFLDLIYIFYKN